MGRFGKILILLIGCFLADSVAAQESRNVITNTYSRGDVGKHLIRDQSWVPYPANANRAAWAKVPQEVRMSAINEGEHYIGYSWPVIKATDYLAFTRTGDRAVVDTQRKTFSEVFRALLMAELMEGKGRFLDDLINGVFAICERTYWGHSAHFYLYGYEGSLDSPTTVLPDIDDPIIDLGVGDIAADLAWAWYFLHEEFDKVSPIISRRLRDELHRKVLDPYYTRSDFWWMYGWRGEGNVNNWNPWVNHNVLTCILLLEDDPVKRADAVYKSLGSVDIFLNHYPKDGSCSEGPGYWSGAVGQFYGYLEMIHKATNGKIDIFQNEKVKEMAGYIYRVYISKGVHYTNYSDAAHKINRSPAPLYRIGSRIGDPVMKSFAAFLYKSAGDEERALGGRIGENLEILFNPVDWASTRPEEPLISEFYFPDWDVVVARDKPGTNQGFYFSAKGGSNHEQHNHNDVGSFILHFNGLPVFLDVGVGTYTRETFGKGRYGIWTMQSNYHNLPVINGLGQKNGGSYEAFDSKYTPSKDKISYSTNIAKAYPPEAGVRSWVRTYTLDRRKKFTVTDHYELSTNRAPIDLHFMTKLTHRVVKPGVLRLSGEDFELDVKYNPELLAVSTEPIKIDDPKLAQSLGDAVSRIVFKVKNNALRGNVSLEIMQAK